MSRKIILIFTTIFICSLSYSQAYKSINIGPAPEYVTIESFAGIDINAISYSHSTGFSITFFNTNYNYQGERNNYSFDYYLSYKGKRVSDYFSTNISCRREKTISNIYVWPSTVPAGNEKYVTVQFGREKPKRDRRDDEY